jgi:hypothetical protein
MRYEQHEAICRICQLKRRATFGTLRENHGLHDHKYIYNTRYLLVLSALYGWPFSCMRVTSITFNKLPTFLTFRVSQNDINNDNLLKFGSVIG